MHGGLKNLHIMAVLPVVVALLLMPGLASIAYGQTETATPSQPGVTASSDTVTVNQSGTFIKIPVLPKLDVSWADIMIFYNDTGVYVTVIAYDPNGVIGTIDVEDPNLIKITTISVDVPGKASKKWFIQLPSGSSYPFIVIHAILNNHDFGLYAVRKEASPVVDINRISGVDERLGVLFGLVAIAPIAGVALRGRPKEAGVALVAFSFFYTPVMHYMGLHFPLPEFVGAFSGILGLLLALIEPESQ